MGCTRCALKDVEHAADKTSASDAAELLFSPRANRCSTIACIAIAPSQKCTWRSAASMAACCAASSFDEPSRCSTRLWSAAMRSAAAQGTAAGVRGGAAGAGARTLGAGASSSTGARGGEGCGSGRAGSAGQATWPSFATAASRAAPKRARRPCSSAGVGGRASPSSDSCTSPRSAPPGPDQEAPSMPPASARTWASRSSVRSRPARDSTSARAAASVARRLREAWSRSTASRLAKSLVSTSAWAPPAAAPAPAVLPGPPASRGNLAGGSGGSPAGRGGELSTDRLALRLGVCSTDSKLSTDRWTLRFGVCSNDSMLRLRSIWREWKGVK
mmetsp:Transcript_37289/g.105278  ORF Transcript_37289/g.105278 Transcript_37289/m.105278 type:complete len:330 (+) Transcript_37289:217-1206(+)